MKTINRQQEEYKIFLKNIREEREESSNLIKLIITVIMALLCATIACVILVENNLFLNFSQLNTEESVGVFKFSREKNKNLPK